MLSKNILEFSREIYQVIKSKNMDFISWDEPLYKMVFRKCCCCKILLRFKCSQILHLTQCVQEQKATFVLLITLIRVRLARCLTFDYFCLRVKLKVITKWVHVISSPSFLLLVWLYGFRVIAKYWRMLWMIVVLDFLWWVVE